ncbi:MAG: deoxyribonuclease IV [Phycisphaeraceae bacterium]|nr:deoxyribonuclease IV [Phycisphaeraceae bacterium]
MFGSHLSIAGSMVNALHEAEKLGLDTVQVFTKNQQQWKAKPLDPAMVTEWKGEVKRLAWGDRIVSHASYLINLASANEELWEKSVNLMLDEIERCETLGIRYLVHHPGAAVGQTREEGLARIAKAYKVLFKQTKGYTTVSCLENTAGAGTTLGRSFEELGGLRRMILDGTGCKPERIGFCIDTCHAHAAGYDMSDRAGGAAMLEALNGACGLEHVRVLHMNDSQAPAGSNKDRHAHIGEGTIGGGTTPKRLASSGFATVLECERFATIPKIMETPKEDAKDGTPMDTVNLGRLRKLAGG